MLGLSMDMYAAHRRLPMQHHTHHLIHPSHHHHHAAAASHHYHPSAAPGPFLFPMQSNFTTFPLIDSAASSTHKFGLIDSFGSGGGSSLFLPPTASIFNAVNITNLGENLFGSHREFESTAELKSTTTTKTELEPAIVAKEDEVTSSAEEITVVDEQTPSIARTPPPPPTLLPNVIGFCAPQPAQPPPPSSIASPYYDREAIFEASAKLLFLAVKWAKSMPSFAQILPKDQKTLLEESWSELFVITAAQYGLVFERKHLNCP